MNPFEDIEDLPIVRLKPVDEDPPRVYLKRTMDAAESLVNRLSDMVGTVATGDLCMKLADRLSDVLRIPKGRFMILTLHEFMGAPVDKQLLWRIALKVLGNKEKLERMLSVPAWSSSRVAWTAVVVVDVLVNKDKDKAPSVGVKAIALTGEPAGSVLVQRFPVKYARWFLKEIGLPKYDQVSELELYNSMFSVRLEESSGRSAMRDFHVNSFQSKHNKRLHKNRDDCPERMPWFCDRCPMGSGDCEFAVKRESWPIKRCVNGHDGYFKRRSDGSYGDLCVKCSLLKKEK